MSTGNSVFIDYLNEHDDLAWKNILIELEDRIHTVDRQATRIWFSFYPIKLNRALAESAIPEETIRKLILKGNFRLSEQVDESAAFVYGHRYWPDVKQIVSEYAASGVFSNSLAIQISDVAIKVADKVRTDKSLVLGITAIAFGTLQQVGSELFSKPAANLNYGAGLNASPDAIIKKRIKDDSQGMFGFLNKQSKQFTVKYNELNPECNFQIMDNQEVTMAAMQVKGDYHLHDSRCVQGEGPIPVECRSASCGTCWVGVLSPTEKLTPPDTREKERWKYFGYEGFTGEQDSVIRLACQLRAHGNITLVIPPWSGLIGKLD